MKAEEAKEFLRGQKQKPEEAVEPNRFGIDSALDDIIKVIECGEKYKQMWGELGIKLYRIDDVGFQEHYRISNVLIAMESLYKKYFPEPIKKTITFTIEAPTADHLGTAINDFEMFWASYNEDIGHCIKYRYGEE